MLLSRLRVVVRLAILLLSSSPLAVSADEQRIDFAHDIAPILKARCAECHTNGKYQGSLSLDSRADLLKSETVVPGKSGDSEFLRRVTSTDPDERMPQEADPLPPKEIALLKAWIDQGLLWEPGFSFKATQYVAPLKPRRVDLPAPRDGWEHPIDRLVAQYWHERNITPPPLADDATFARRVTLDLVGQLPATDELQAFLADQASEKRAIYVQRLLADRRNFADHWLAFWNDLLRNEYRGTGYIDGGRKQISEWLYQALLDNKPYDQLVRELIDPSPESEGFILGIKWRGRVNASQVPPIQFSQNISQVFFGINMKCASCHDSFIDNWKLDDAYGLAAVISEEPLEIHRCDKGTERLASPRFLWSELGAIDPNGTRAERLKQLAGLVTHRENGRFTRTIVNRLWHRLIGRGLVHPVDVMANPPWNADLLDYLAEYLVDSGYDLQKMLEHIVTSRTYQSEAVAVAEEIESEEFVFRGPQVKRMSAEQFVDAIWQITGTAPAKPHAPMKIPDHGDAVPSQRRFVRSSLMHADPLMRSLGRPNREQVVTNRGDVLTTLQALDLSNGPEMTELMARGAAHLHQQLGNETAAELAEWLFLRALSREPTAEERSAAESLIGDPVSVSGLEDLLWAVCMLPEFQIIR